MIDRIRNKCIHIKRNIWKGNVRFWISYPFIKKKSKISEKEALDLLNRFYQCNGRSSIKKNRLTREIQCDLQIIVPAYNVEKTLENCIDSILAQETSFSFKIVIIDDGSTDMTPEIADKYCTESHITVIHQENKGLSGARNTGLDVLYGNYVMFVDSDDKLMPGAINDLMETAYEKNADIVQGGYSVKSGEKVKNGISYSEMKEIPYEKLQGFAWGKVYKRELWENIHFPENYWFEDSVNSFLIFPQAINSYVVPSIVYMYYLNPNGITQTSKNKPKSLDTFWIMRQLDEERKMLGYVSDDVYCRRLLKQIRLNYQRTSWMPEYIQESIFVLSAEIFNSKKWDMEEEKILTKALQNFDFGMYKLYFETH